jgi:EF hand domain-containing protein
LRASNLAAPAGHLPAFTGEKIMTKKSALSLLFVAGSMLATSAAFAGGDKTMDADGDGVVSASEHAAGSTAMFTKMDANQDGSVTAAEMEAAHAAKGKTKMAGELSTAEKIKAIDTNGDGKLSAAEHSAGSQSMFEKMDTDKNGSLSKAESDAGHKALMTKR